VEILGFLCINSLWRFKLFGKLVSISYVLNIIFQAFFTLLTPAGLGFLCSYLLVRFANTPSWIYAPLLTVGILLGFVSMVRFILTAMASYERLEKERRAGTKEGTNNYAKRKASSDAEAARSAEHKDSRPSDTEANDHLH
jgi:hypothetical protein